MRTVDAITVRAPTARVFEAARDVERWPAILPHYRWVRFLERRDGGGLVEMAAWRPFGRLRWPTWWVSEMTVDPAASAVRYRHVRGITTGMAVVWRVAPDAAPGMVRVEIVHEWTGPRWPLVGGAAAGLVIGPVFIHGIASRTLAGIKRYAESSPPSSLASAERGAGSAELDALTAPRSEFRAPRLAPRQGDRGRG